MFPRCVTVRVRAFGFVIPCLKRHSLSLSVGFTPGTAPGVVSAPVINSLLNSVMAEVGPPEAITNTLVEGGAEFVLGGKGVNAL